MTSRHPLSVRKAEILEFLRIRESLNVLYRFKINVEFRTCFTGSIPYIGNIQMAPLKLKKLWRRGLDHLIWSAKEGKATELMKWKADDGLRSLRRRWGRRRWRMRQLAEEVEATATYRGEVWNKGKGKDWIVISYQVGFKRDENTLTIDRRTKIYGFYNDRAVFCRNHRCRVSRKNDFLEFSTKWTFYCISE